MDDRRGRRGQEQCPAPEHVLPGTGGTAGQRRPLTVVSNLLMNPASKAAMSIEFFEFPLVGPANEPVDLSRTFRSHGLGFLPPMRLDEEANALEVTLPLNESAPRTVRISRSRPGYGAASVLG